MQFTITLGVLKNDQYQETSRFVVRVEAGDPTAEEILAAIPASALPHYLLMKRDHLYLVEPTTRTTLQSSTKVSTYGIAEGQLLWLMCAVR